MNQLQIADRNIKLYIFIKIFAKRVFLPLSAIYFIDTAGFTIQDIGILAAFYSLVQLVAEVPTGYFADRIGRVASIRLGALSCVTATLCYIFFSTKFGIFTGTFFEALGYSFLGGAGEALIHDSLVVKKLQDSYTKVMSRAMAISLVANAVLISLVPMTYAIDPRYPYMIGTLAYLCLFLAGMYMQDLPGFLSRKKIVISELKQLTGKRYILLACLSFGIISAFYSSNTDTINVAMREYGIPASLLGWIFGISSLVGALLGYLIQYLGKVKLSTYLLVDLAVILFVFLGGYSQSAPLLATAVIIAVSFYRYRKIIYQNYLLAIFPTSYKATLISSMNNLEQLNSVWLALLITSLVYYTNIHLGIGLMGIFAFLIAPVFYFSMLKFFARDLTPQPLVNHPGDAV